MKRTSITVDDAIYDAGQLIASKRGFGTSFSAYISWLIKRDAEGGVTREETPSLREMKTRGRKPRVTLPNATPRRGRRKAAKK